MKIVTTGRYTFYCSTGRDGAYNVSRRDGTVRIFSHCCTGERNEEHTALGTKAAVLRVKFIRRTYHIIIRHGILCTLSTGTNL